MEDHFETRLIYEKFLRRTPFQIISARTVREAENVLGNLKPAAIILDILLNGEDTWTFLAETTSQPARRDIPVIVVTSVEDQRKALALGAKHYAAKPVERETLLRLLSDVTGIATERKVLLIDDQEISRYIVKQLFADPAPASSRRAADPKDY